MKSHERLLQVSLSIGATSAVLAGLIFFGVLDLSGLKAATSNFAVGVGSQAQQWSEAFGWRGDVASGHTIEIKNLNGAIIARAADGPQVVLEAVKRGRRGHPEDVDIEVVPGPTGVTVCAVYDGSGACEPGEKSLRNLRNSDVSVNFTVAVPKGVHLIGRTLNGGIKVTSLDGDVVANTVNGSVEIETSGWAQAQTVNGSIDASIGALGWSRTLDFHTVNGEIQVRLPAGVNADVAASSLRGMIRSEFDLVQGLKSRNRLSGMIGSGGGDLTLKTVSGGIRIIRVD